MKKTIFSFFALPFIALCFCMTLHAQSPENDLDQVELMKQFLGTWEIDFGNDSTQRVEIIPSGKGQYALVEWQSKGKTYATGRCVTGLTPNKESLVMYCLWPNALTIDMGKFISETELIVERYLPDGAHPIAISKIEFPTPDTYVWDLHNRGREITWNPQGTVKWTFKKVKQ
jgi:hypothetical protein